jgi:hypothetical protein
MKNTLSDAQPPVSTLIGVFRMLTQFSFQVCHPITEVDLGRRLCGLHLNDV